MNLLLLAFGFFPLVASAGPFDPEAIYKGLKTKEMNVTPKGILGVGQFRKSAGALVCERHTAVYPGAKSEYTCELEGDGDMEAAYKAIPGAEKNITPEGILGATTFKKELGGLICKRIQPVVPRPKSRYSCDILTTSPASESDDDDSQAAD